MESIGEKLRTEREQKNYSIEQIARDTNIAKRYLIALEAEDFTVFPGDPYLIGFLKNYAEYLGLDPEEMVSLYRNFTIQSQPLPMDELLEKKRPGRIWLILLLVMVLGALGVAAFFLVPVIFDRKTEAPASDSAQSGTVAGSEYRLADRPLERRLVANDAIVIELSEVSYRMTIVGIAENVTLEIPGGTNVLRIGDERAVDLDGDAKMDVRVALTDIDSSAAPPSAVIRIERYASSTTAESAAAPAVFNSSATTGAQRVTGTSDVGAPGLGSREIAPVDISRSAEARPYRVAVIFRGHCLLRYVIDGEQREERYFQKGETIDLDVTREIRLWVSNAGSMIARIDGVELDLGRPGEVATRLVSWNRAGSSGDYVLRMVAMY